MLVNRSQKKKQTTEKEKVNEPTTNHKSRISVILMSVLDNRIERKKEYKASNNWAIIVCMGYCIFAFHWRPKTWRCRCVYNTFI